MSSHTLSFSWKKWFHKVFEVPWVAQAHAGTSGSQEAEICTAKQKSRGKNIQARSQELLILVLHMYEVLWGLHNSFYPFGVLLSCL